MNLTNAFEMSGNIDIGWCPGCGNFNILKILESALDELRLNPQKTVIVSGIGQAAKIPQYVNAHMFNGLHGRALPVATAIKASNPALMVIAESGDGDMYGEGGNHFIHVIRRNPNITNIVHDNMVYGLTKGQASPTSQKGFKTPVQVNGVTLRPLNPMAMAISLGATFVARASSGDVEQAKEIFKKAILHKGYALVDIFQPCVTFNKINNFMWFKNHTYYLDDSYDPHDKIKAFEKSLELEEGKIPLGVLYENNEEETFEETLVAYSSDKRPLYEREVSFEKIEMLINSKK